MDIHFEKACLKDIPALLNLCRKIAASPGTSWNEAYPNRTVLEQDIQSGTLYRIITSGSDLLGLISISNGEELSELAWDHSPCNPCEIARFGIAPSYQGKGIGKLVLCRVLGLCKDMGFDTARILVVPGYTHAVNLYEKQGFHSFGRVHMWDMDFICYQKRPL